MKLICVIHNVVRVETDIGSGKRAMRCPKCEEGKLEARRSLMNNPRFDITRPRDWEPFEDA